MPKSAYAKALKLVETNLAFPEIMTKTKQGKKKNRRKHYAINNNPLGGVTTDKENPFGGVDIVFGL